MVEAQILQGARVYRHGEDCDVPPIADVLLNGTRIAAVGPRGSFDADAQGAQRIDLSGHLLIPGFVNAHYHSFDTLAKGAFESMPLDDWAMTVIPVAGAMNLEQIRLRTLAGAIECLRNGITTTQDFCILSPMDEARVDAVLDAYSEAGLRVILSIAVRDRSQLATTPWAEELVPKHLQHVFGDKADGGEFQLQFVRRQIDRIGDQDDMVIWALSPVAPQRCSDSLLAGIADLAMQRNLPIYTHVYETRGQRVFAKHLYSQFGGSQIRQMESLGLLGPHVTIAHGVWPDQSEIKLLAQSGTGVVLNMMSNLRLRSGVAPIQAYRRLGVRLALGCDNCSCSDVQSMFQAMKLYCLMGGIAEATTAGPLASEAMRLATAGGAHTAAQSHSLGAIEPGRRADLVALDLSDPAYRPLNSAVRQVVYADSGRSVRHVWVNGKQVVRNGRSTLVDEQQLASQLEQIMPAYRRELERRRLEMTPLKPVLTEIHRRSWAHELDLDE